MERLWTVSTPCAQPSTFSTPQTRSYCRLNAWAVSIMLPLRLKSELSYSSCDGTFSVSETTNDIRFRPTSGHAVPRDYDPTVRGCLAPAYNRALVLRRSVGLESIAISKVTAGGSGDP